ncbi:MAG: DUF177 domain-containing protein [Oscillospiraceae bacterium]|jgi:uncharacterized protein|nr:DUF177 domain-containing protein [Oscillospiraceae bacterium]
MKLDIKSIPEGGSLDFSDSYDLSDMDFFGEKPIAQPLNFTGTVSRRAGLWTLTGELGTRLHLRCDRCNRRFTRDKTLPVTLSLALSLQDDERDDIAVCPGGICDLGQIAIPEWVLDMEYVNLCAEDCKGLCPQCGADLNSGPCDCQ